MADRRLALLFVLLTPLVTFALFLGVITVGLVPLAAFGPLYAIGRSARPTGDLDSGAGCWMSCTTN